jgi:group II intron reverse transcriptase/maturase/CRISPR-associated endonuclease Cas1
MIYETVTKVYQDLKALSWIRLSIKLCCQRVNKVHKTYPISVLQAIVKGVSSRCAEFSSVEAEDLPIFHICGKKHTSKIKPGDFVESEIVFTKYSTDKVIAWRDCLLKYFEIPGNARTFELVSVSDPEERNLETISKQMTQIPIENELCLDFLTPLYFKHEPGKSKLYISKTQFIRGIEKRLFRLFGEVMTYKSSLDDFEIFPYYWNYTEIRHPSHSQPGTIQLIKGCVGKFYLKGKFKDFLPFLILGGELHTGNKLSNSQGYYNILPGSCGFFDTTFPNASAILKVIREVVEIYDQALESLSRNEMYPFEEEKFADQLCQEIKNGKYQPSPNIAFSIKKENGKSRTIEQLNFKDLIVSRYLLKILNPVFDNFFEEESLGFRKGISRKKAISMVNDSLKEGFELVLESDIENFFPSIDLKILQQQMEMYLPKNDTCLKETLLKVIKNGCILNGKYIERLKGLAQGNPLSPILSNLYLDYFDEEVKKLDVRLIRYADDFIILCRDQNQAEETLNKTFSFLSEPGLKVNKEKTMIKPVSEGFQFLGMKFGAEHEKPFQETYLKRLKKPLFITEPYAYLSLNGDSLDIKRDGHIINSFPLRRISEIMVMEKALFSTALIRKCVENYIPFTITLNSGYYITTIKPDSKRYFAISHAHSKKYYSLGDTEVLSIAKEFASGKISNYISFFKQKYKKGDNLILNELYEIKSRIHQAAGIQEVRGIEGWAAKKSWNKLNDIINNSFFHMNTRHRREPDRMNSLLNFGYYLLFSRINAIVRAKGLNPYLGFLHSPNDDYESLVCDIQELFRSHVDRFICRIINLKIITEDDFTKSDRGYYLSRRGVSRFLEYYEVELEQKQQDPPTLSLKEHIGIQVELLKKWILDDVPLSFYSWEENSYE